MSKNLIKKILRENLFGTLEEKGKNTPETEKSKIKKEKKKSSTETEYADVQNKLDNTMLKQNQVMAAAGLGNPDNATDRSLFSKKVHKEKNDEGGTYMFDDDELSKVTKVLSNPASYLSKKK
jgi:predicted 2-oxoglutarate/Fe(II)-dependent dioxygenase YbiX